MTKLIAFIGHRAVKNLDLVEIRLFSLVEKFILEGHNGFIFGSNSQFDRLAYHVVMKLREKHSHIKVFNFYCGNENPCQERYFDKIHFPENCRKAGRKLYVERNKAMIDFSQVVVFYYEDNYIPHTQTASGTKIAYDYAISKSKQIFNLFTPHISSLYYFSLNKRLYHLQGVFFKARNLRLRNANFFADFHLSFSNIVTHKQNFFLSVV